MADVKLKSDFVVCEKCGGEVFRAARANTGSMVFLVCQKCFTGITLLAKVVIE